MIPPRFLALTLNSRQLTALSSTSCAGFIDPKRIEILFILLRGARDQTLLRLSDRLVL